MAFRLALAQCAHRADGDAIALVEDWAGRAADAGADLLAFPESLMTPFELTREQFIAAAEPLDGPFGREVAAIARERGLWMLYCANELNPSGGAPFNSAVLVDDAGERRAVYRKVHLFDVGDYRESEKMSAGDRIFEPVQTPFCRLGLGICYDLRFPELARKQALAGAQLLLYPAAWVAGPRKVEQWQTLLKARAIENGVYVAGLCRVGDIYSGHSLVAGPTGEVIATAGSEEQLICCEIDPDAVAATQAAVPVLAHRREELY